MRVLAYARVSSVGQEEHGTSLESQREEFARYCIAKGWPTPTVFVEVEGGGASSEERRVEQARLLASVRTGDVVLVAKQDRWSRHALYYLRTIEALLATGAKLVSIAEAWDHSDPAGKTAAGMMALIAEQELARIRERTVSARRRLRALGHFVEGPPPLGYLVDREARRLVPDPGAVPVVCAMFELAAAGGSTREIARQLARQYPEVRGLDASAIARRLRSRVYIGEMAIRGTKGKRPSGEHVKSHAPIIDALIWRRAQRSLDDRRWGGRRSAAASGTADFLLRGLVRCGHCGHVCASQVVSAGGSTTHGGWYQCARCPRPPRIPHAHLDEAVVDAVLVRLRELSAVLDREAREPARPTQGQELARRRAAVTAKLTRLVEAVEDGTLPRQVARERMAALTAALEAIDSESVVPAPTAAETRAAARAWRQFARGWQQMTLDERRDVIGRLAAEIVLWRHGARWTRASWQWGIRWRTS